MLIVPAIDIYDKKTVRLSKGDFNNITYYPLSPLDQAKQYAEYGFKRIHIVDLQGSANGETTILDILKSIKTETNLEIEFGGGIRNYETVQAAFSVGVDKIIIGSLAVKDKPKFEFILHSYNPLLFIVSADVNGQKQLPFLLMTTSPIAHLLALTSFFVPTFQKMEHYLGQTTLCMLK